MAPSSQDVRMTPEAQALARRHWRKTRRLTLVLLLVWFVVTFGLPYFARELSFRFFGWPFSFWMAAQGALVVYGVIIAYYAWHMNRLDDRFREGKEAVSPKSASTDPLHWG